jgi:hypothetical protein
MMHRFMMLFLVFRGRRSLRRSKCVIEFENAAEAGSVRHDGHTNPKR